jgi:5-(carboxyamino)imidazole ribonucleotide synthase
MNKEWGRGATWGETTNTGAHSLPHAAVLYPGSTIGVLGGGQLGRMMALAARRMGYRIVVLDPSPRCPTAQVADGVVIGALDDIVAAQHLAAQVDVITLDTEHVPADLLATLHDIVPVRPHPSVLRTIQDRLVQKQFLQSLGLHQAQWAQVSNREDLKAALIMLGGHAIVKVRRAGYDGKGQVRISPADQANDKLATLRGEPAVAEQIVDFSRELSVVMARSVTGETAIYPIAENAHRHHVLHTTRAPAPMSTPQMHAAHQIALQIATALNYVGVLAVEMFECVDGTLLVNEIAPRTHNSGHFTYGACATSQFEQHVRAICGLPLGSARGLCGAVMLNLLGDLWKKGHPRWQHVLRYPQARLHLYGKAAPAPGRKMGHVLMLDNDTDQALADCDEMMAHLTAAEHGP